MGGGAGGSAPAPLFGGDKEIGPNLRDWQAHHRFTDRRAAAALGLSERAYRRQKNGHSRVSRQTARLAEYCSAFELNWLDVAELAQRLGQATRGIAFRRSDLTSHPPRSGANSIQVSTASRTMPNTLQLP